MPPSLRLLTSCYNALSRLALRPLAGLALTISIIQHDITYIAMEVYMPFELWGLGQRPIKNFPAVKKTTYTVIRSFHFQSYFI